MRDKCAFILVLSLLSGLLACGSGGNGGGSVTPPAAPAGLTITAGDQRVTLAWNASARATAYHVKRAAASGGPYTTIASANTTTYSDTGLTNGTRYFYVVSASNSAGESPHSAEVSATPAPAAPSAPTGLVATAGNQQVALSWSASTSATSYHVKRASAAGGPYTQIAAPTTTSYSDTGLTNGTAYFYVVTAVNAGGESANSAEVSATPVAPPAVPSGVTATAGNQQVVLAWSATAGASSYHVKRASAAGGPYTQIAAPTTTSYTDSGLTNGTAYFYVVTAVNAGGESGNSTEVSATPAPPAPPVVPTALTATAGDQQVWLSWNASTGATSYRVKRATVAGGPYTPLASPSANSYTDGGLTNGIPYYYVVSAVGTGGESANSSEVSATPVGPSASVTIDVNVLRDRHPISPYIYGVNFPSDIAGYVGGTGATLIRWGGNASTRYNWKNFDTNAAADWYFWNRTMDTWPAGAYLDSLAFVSDTAAAGGNPIMTIGMLPWVAKDSASYSFSVAKYGPQCRTEQWHPDVGNGQLPDCTTNITNNDPNDAHVPLLDSPSGSDPAGSVYRSEWVAALAPRFGLAPHFYNMDNEIDIWGGTHRDVHPNPATYEEQRDIFVQKARAVKSWDPQAITFGPVACCWWFYWSSAAGGNDKTAHAGIDFFPWWLNEVAWKDRVDGVRSLDVFDFHSYIDGPDTSTLTLAEKQALAGRLPRDYWDATYVSEGGVNQPWWTQTQFNNGIPFRIPRMRAWVNAVYPGTLLASTEWNTSPAGEGDFSTALVDADIFGIFGRERMFAAARWTAAESTTPAYQALKLYRNYDGQHHGFGTVSVAATHNASSNLLSTYAALDDAGSTLTLMVLNKDPLNAVSTQINLAAFNAMQVRAYTLSSAQPNTIVAGAPTTWNGNRTFPAYSATLLVITGGVTLPPSVEWDLNPESINMPAGSTVVLHPRIVSGNGTVTLTTTQADNGVTVTNTQPVVADGQDGTITVAAGNTPGFYHFSVNGQDNAGVTQTQGGWIVVGKPAATFTKTDPLPAPRGSVITLTLTLNPGQSGGTAPGASVLFSADAGTLSSRIVTTDSSGIASVKLTLPNEAATVHVTAEGPYGLGHPVATFTVTSQ